MEGLGTDSEDGAGIGTCSDGIDTADADDCVADGFVDNEVSVESNPVGFTNDVDDDDSATVELFVPNLTIVKTCFPDPVFVGDTLTFRFVITNTSTANSPNLNRVSVTDTFLGNIAGSFPASLAPAASVQVDIPYTVLLADKPLISNTVTAIYQVDGFPNLLTRGDSASCEVKGQSLLTPTQATCLQFVTDTAPELTELRYGIGKQQGQSTGLISEVNPGHAFDFTPVTIGSIAGTADEVSIQQSTTNGFPEFTITQVQVLDSSCNALFFATCQEGALPTDCTFEIGSPGSFVIRVRFDPMSISGSSAACPGLLSSTYAFETLVDSVITSGDTVDLDPKPNATCP